MIAVRSMQHDSESIARGTPSRGSTRCGSVRRVSVDRNRWTGSAPACGATRIEAPARIARSAILSQRPRRNVATGNQRLPGSPISACETLATGRPPFWKTMVRASPPRMWTGIAVQSSVAHQKRTDSIGSIERSSSQPKAPQPTVRRSSPPAMIVTSAPVGSAIVARRSRPAMPLGALVTDPPFAMAMSQRKSTLGTRRNDFQRERRASETRRPPAMCRPPLRTVVYSSRPPRVFTIVSPPMMSARNAALRSGSVEENSCQENTPGSTADERGDPSSASENTSAEPASAGFVSKAKVPRRDVAGPEMRASASMAEAARVMMRSALWPVETSCAGFPAFLRAGSMCLPLGKCRLRGMRL